MNATLIRGAPSAPLTLRDYLGLVPPILCAVECTGRAVLTAVVPQLLSAWSESETLEQVLWGVSVVMCMTTIARLPARSASSWAGLVAATGAGVFAIGADQEIAMKASLAGLVVIQLAALRSRFSSYCTGGPCCRPTPNQDPQGD